MRSEGVGIGDFVGHGAMPLLSLGICFYTTPFPTPFCGSVPSSPLHKIQPAPKLSTSTACWFTLICLIQFDKFFCHLDNINMYSISILFSNISRAQWHQYAPSQALTFNEKMYWRNLANCPVYSVIHITGTLLIYFLYFYRVNWTNINDESIKIRGMSTFVPSPRPGRSQLSSDQTFELRFKGAHRAPNVGHY